MPEKEHKMTILLSESVKNRLIKLARDAGISQGAICRQLINHAAQMHYQQLATCATGQPCLCPHLHSPRPPLPPDPVTMQPKDPAKNFGPAPNPNDKPIL